MGDRALVLFSRASESNGRLTEISPAIYLHGSGSTVLHMLKEAASRLRHADPYYSAARFCGYCHTKLDGNLGLGLLPAPDITTDTPLDELFSEFSHGDAGTFVVDVDSWDIHHYGGYSPLGYDNKEIPYEVQNIADLVPREQ